jgi:hypothetical protein
LNETVTPDWHDVSPLLATVAEPPEQVPSGRPHEQSVHVRVSEMPP